MGFMWEGSTGARAVEILRGLPRGTIIETPEFAAMLQVKPGAIHQLLLNAVKLRFIRKLGLRPARKLPGAKRTSRSSGWCLGAGNISATIEQHSRRPESPSSGKASVRRRATQQRDTSDSATCKFRAAGSWPPGFVSKFFDAPSTGWADKYHLSIPALDRALPVCRELRAFKTKLAESDVHEADDRP